MTMYGYYAQLKNQNQLSNVTENKQKQESFQIDLKDVFFLPFGLYYSAGGLLDHEGISRPQSVVSDLTHTWLIRYIYDLILQY